jgi:DNA-binding CsgD family transcriptional regulator
MSLSVLFDHGHADPLEAIAALENKYDAYAFLRQAARSHGFDYFALLTVLPEGERQIAGHLLLSNLPDAFIASYDGEGLAARNPFFAKLRRHTRPADWQNQEGDNCDPATKALMVQYGVTAALFLSVHDRVPHRGVAVFLGERRRPELRETAYLSLVTNAVFDRLADFGSLSIQGTEVRLTERERQTLQWAATGKTSAETGIILGLSEHTINQYVASACQKLRAVNRTQAVARAIRLRLID